MNYIRYLRVSNERRINVKNINEVEINNDTCIIYLSNLNMIGPNEITINAKSKFYENVKQFIVNKFLQVSTSRYINTKTINKIEVYDDKCILHFITSNRGGSVGNEPLIVNTESQFYEIIKQDRSRKFLKISDNCYINTKNISEIEFDGDIRKGSSYLIHLINFNTIVHYGSPEIVKVDEESPSYEILNELI